MAADISFDSQLSFDPQELQSTSDRRELQTPIYLKESQSPIDSVDFLKRLSLETAHSVTQNLKCHKCNKLYQNPKILPCLHYFCQDCIENSMISNKRLTCFTCREETPCTTKISELMTHYPLVDLIQLNKTRDQIINYPNDIYCFNCSFGNGNTKGIAYCCDCKEIMCRHDKVAHDKYKTTHRSVTIDELRDEKYLEKFLSDLAAIKCKKHPKQDIKYYCVECEQQICDDCGFGDHSTHKKTYLKAALNLFADSVDHKMDELRNPGMEMVKDVNHYEEYVKEMASRQGETVERIKKHFNEMIKNLEERRDSMILNINAWYSNLRNQLYTLKEKQNDLVQRIIALADFMTNYREYPNNYKVELASVITKRFTCISNSIPKIPLNIKAVEYERGIESEIENHIDNFGWLKHIDRTNFATPIKQLTKEDFVSKCVFNLENSESETMHDVQGMAQGFQNKLYVFTSSFADEEATNRYEKDRLQILDSQCNIIDTVICPSIMKNPTQILIGQGNLIYILERDLKHIIIRDETFHRTIKKISADEINNISDPSSIALTSKHNLVIHNRSSNELVILDREEYNVCNRIPLKALALKRKESPLNSLARTDSVQRSGSRGKAKLSVPEKDGVKSPNRDQVITGSVTLAVNSKDRIYVANEDRALITVYSLEGKEVGEINFQERLKLVEEQWQHEQKSTNTDVDSSAKEKTLTRKQTSTTITTPSKSIQNTTPKRSTTAKPTRAETVSPTVLQSSSRTLITIDSLDNIYVFQKNWIIMFDPQHRFNTASKIGPTIEPVSINVNSLGYVYIMSEKGDICIYN